jgi:chromosome partitioning protein
MAPVITVAGLKGGVGKTCTAMALAAADAAEGGPTLVVDADPNGSAVRWHRRGDDPLPFECVAIQSAPMAMQRKEWSTVIVDTAGGSKDEQEEYARGSSLVICPCQPAASSLEQVLDLAELIKPTGADFAVLLTMVDSRRKQDAVRARKLLEGQDVPVFEQTITSLSAWPKAEAAGVSICDARTDSGRPDPGAARAWEEVVALHKEIATRIKAGEQLTIAA